MKKTMTVNDYGGQKTLIESCQRIDVRHLLDGYRASLGQSAVNFDDLTVVFTRSRTGNGGTRLWFKCPLCERRIGSIFRSVFGQIGCRLCLGLKYRSSRYKGMVESDLGC